MATAYKIKANGYTYTGFVYDKNDNGQTYYVTKSDGTTKITSSNTLYSNWDSAKRYIPFKLKSSDGYTDNDYKWHAVSNGTGTNGKIYVDTQYYVALGQHGANHPINVSTIQKNNGAFTGWITLSEFKKGAPQLKLRYRPNGGTITNKTHKGKSYVEVNWTDNLWNPAGDFSRTGYHMPSNDKAWRLNNATSGTVVSAEPDAFTTTVEYVPGNVTSYLNLYVNWQANTYTVKYDGNGNTGGSTSSSSHTYDTAKKLTANGFTRSHKVTFNYNGSGASNTSSTVTHTFAGWATSSKGSVAYSNQQSVTNLTSTNGGTVTLYAVWTLNSVTLPTPTWTGHTFAGWYDAASGGNKVTSLKPTANKTLYAHWTTNTYTNTINHYQKRDANFDGANKNGWKFIESTTFTAKYGATVTVPTDQIRTYTGHYNTGQANSESWSWSAKTIGSGTFTQPAGGITIEYYYNGYTLTVKYKSGKVDIGTLEGTSLTANQLAGTEVFHEQSGTYGNNFGGTSGLANYNNSDFIYLRKYGFRVPSGSEWKNGSYTCTQNGTFTTQQIASNLGVSINSKNQTVTVEPNWQGNNLVKIYNGTSWVNAVPMIYNGGWQETIPHVYNGSWKQCK